MVVCGIPSCAATARWVVRFLRGMCCYLSRSSSKSIPFLPEFPPRLLRKLGAAMPASCSLYRFHTVVTCLREQANCCATRLMSPWANLPFLLPSKSSSITARVSFSFRFFLLTVPAAPPATDMVIRVWESNLPEILLSEL